MLCHIMCYKAQIKIDSKLHKYSIQKHKCLHEKSNTKNLQANDIKNFIINEGEYKINK